MTMRAVGSFLLVVALATSCARRTRADDELQRTIETALRAEQITDVEVSVSRHIVTLRGVVNSVGEQNHAERVVRAFDGIVAVDDRLLVQQPPAVTAPTADAEEAASISSALAAAGFHHLHVHVQQGTVRVLGKVSRARHTEAMRMLVDAAPSATIEDETTPE